MEKNKLSKLYSGPRQVLSISHLIAAILHSQEECSLFSPCLPYFEKVKPIPLTRPDISLQYHRYGLKQPT